MNRIVTRLGLLLLYGVVAGGTATACASEDSTFRPLPSAGGASNNNSAGAGATAGASDKPLCKPEFCPMHPPAKQCCATMYDCGLDWNTGTCMPNSKKDGGQ